MAWALIAAVALLLVAPGDSPSRKPAKGTPAPITAKQPTLNAASLDADRSQTNPEFDEQAEAELLKLANRDRALVGLPALELDSRLVAAARKHAMAMAQQRQLSHQFPGEASLANRIAETGDLRLDLAGENVALDVDVNSAQDHLMASPPHRRNLLDPAFNAAGFAVVRFDGTLYVVQDFAHRLARHSLHQTESMVVGAVNQWRAQRGLKALTASAPSLVRDAACGMAQTNTLSTRTVRELSQRQAVITYTQSQPEVLPGGIDRILGNPQLKRASVGVCFGRGPTYPHGTFWILLSVE